MSRARVLYALWIAGILTLFCLHFPHLLADFPNHSPWMDYSKYTDEGWYANAAIRHYLRGHWYLRGDFNPAVALPVWPLLVAAVFHFTGVSLSAVRALVLVIFGLNLVLSYLVVRTQTEPWIALFAVTVLVCNPFLYAFSRLALLEPLLMGILLFTWWLALRLPRLPPRARRLALCGIGLLLCLLILTKTTAVFVLPSTLYLIAHACGFRLRSSLRALAIAVSAAALPWCAWYFLLVRPHYPADYMYLFNANRWPQPTALSGWLAAFWYALHGMLWLSPALCAIAAAVLLLALIPSSGAESPEPRRPAPSGSSWRNPLVLASLLAVAGTVFFAGWHNSPQPRYYEMAAYPLSFAVAVGIADLLRPGRSIRLRSLAAACAIATGAVCLVGVVRIAGYVRYPEYTWLNAANRLTRTVDEYPKPHRLLLSVSGDDITLMTHLPTICDEYGIWDLRRRLHVYRPGWFAAWNEIDPDTLAALQTGYSLHRVAAFPAFDDPDRNLLILYRLDPLPADRRKSPAVVPAPADQKLNSRQ